MITRRILITTLVNAMGYEYKVYGRFDAVKLISDGWKIVDSKFYHFRMSEKTFVEYATCITNMEDEK